MNNGQQDNGGGGDVTKLQQQLQDIKDQVRHSTMSTQTSVVILW